MVALIDMVNSLIRKNDSVCIIGEDINLKTPAVRMDLYDFMNRIDKFNVLVVNNLQLNEDKIRALVEEAKNRVDVLVCDFTREKKKALEGDQGGTIPFWSDIYKFADQFKEYPFILVNDPGNVSFVALYFRRMLPSM